MVRYLPDRWQAGLTTNGKSTGYGSSPPFALRYRRVKRTFYEGIKVRNCSPLDPSYWLSILRAGASIVCPSNRIHFSEEPRASARGFFQRKSQYGFKATGVRNHTANGRRWSAIPPRSSERGILAFSREACAFCFAGGIFRQTTIPFLRGSGRPSLSRVPATSPRSVS